jgi:HK97 gp10 family phage protein
MTIGLDQLLLKILTLSIVINEGAHEGLTEVGKIVKEEAKSEYGHYQTAIKDVEAWAELSDFTKEDRVSKGFTENDPLYRTGAVKDSVEYHVNGSSSVAIGSDREEAAYLEGGTAKMPARSVLAGSAYRKEKEITEIIGKAVVKKIFK